MAQSSKDQEKYLERDQKIYTNNAEEKITGFVQRNRKAIFILSASAVFVFLVLIGGIIARNLLQEKAIKAVEELAKRAETFLGNEPAAWEVQEEDTGAEDALSSEEYQTLLSDLSAFAGKNSGYAGSRAYSLIARLHGKKKEWKEAGEAWIKAAEKGKKTYLAPVAFYNAAVMAEEQGDTENAIQHYGSCLALGTAFPVSVRAQFALGRLYQERNDFPAAVEAYQKLIDEWPDSETTWKNLARSLIISITAENGLDLD